MKIAIDISQVVFEGTGVSVYTSDLVKNLLGLDTANDYLLFAFGRGSEKKLAQFIQECKSISKKVKFKLYDFPEKIMNFIGNSAHFPYIESIIGSIDIYHSSDWIQYLSYCKSITTVHDLVMYTHPDLSDKYIVSTHKKRLSWVKKQCNGVITVSDNTANDLVKILGFEKSKIRTIYSGVDDVFSSPTIQKNDEVRKKYELPSKYILAVGTREPRKNLSRLIESFHMLRSTPNFSDYYLVIVGNYGWGEDIKAEGNIKLIGYVMRDEMPSVYALAEIFAYPSLYEGFGLPILEAMKSGCPVMTSGIGSMREISDDCAVFVDPNDVNDILAKLKDILTVPKFKKTMIEKGKNHAGEFSWKKTATETLNYYKYIAKI